MRHALSTTLFINLSRFFEQEKRSQCNFNKFIKELEIYAEYSQDIQVKIQLLKTELDNNKDLFNKLFQLRDKAIAHLDDNYFIEQPNQFEDLSFKTDEIKNILSKCFDILNSISYDMTQVRSFEKYINYNDYKRLLEFVNEKYS